MVQCVGLRRLFGRLGIFGIIVFASASAQAGLIITTDEAYKARGMNHPYVGWQDSTEGISLTPPGQSGVLISPHWAIASAHGVLQIDTDRNSLYNNIRMGFGSNYMTDPGETQFSSEIYIHPDYDGGFGGYDLALLYFETPFLTVAPISLFEGVVSAGMDSDIVGFGLMQTVGNPTAVYTGDRRAGNNFIFGPDNFNPDGVRTFLAQPGRSDYLPLGMGGLSGDSGGALVIEDRLAGITKGATLSNNFGQFTRYQLLDYNWIDSTMDIHSSPIPEPSSLLLMLAGVPYLSRRKRETN